MNDDPPKLDKLIGHRPPGRAIAADEVEVEFRLIHATQSAEKKVSTAADFRDVGERSGTHILKLVSSRAEADQNVLRFDTGAGHRGPEFVPSTDAKKSATGKIAYRPLEIEEREPKSLVDHIRHPDNLSPAVTEAFANVYGEEALEALRSGLGKPLPPITTLPAAQFPIIFLPRPGGGDLQVTPVAPAEAYTRMYQVTGPYFEAQRAAYETGSGPAPFFRWHRQLVSDKPQNISSATGKVRTRFLATMPRLLDLRAAEAFRFEKTGAFPRWRDQSILDDVGAYANLVDQNDRYSNADIRNALDRRADGLIRAANLFVSETIDEIRELFPERIPPIDTKCVNIILGLPWRGDEERDRARRVLTGDHFRSRLRKLRVG